jgi:hypothetical protein
MERVDTFHPDIDHAPSDAVTGERRKMEPNAIARNAEVAGVRVQAVRSVGKLFSKPQSATVEGLRSDCAPDV